MCSQPIVQATQLARVFALFERAALKVARWQRAEAVEGQEIGRRAKLAILRRGGAERPLRQILAQRRQLARMGPLDSARTADRDRLDLLGAQHGAAAAAPSMPSVVRDGGVAYEPLASGTDRGNSIARTETALQRCFRLLARDIAILGGGFEAHPVRFVDDQHRELGGAADDDDGVAAAGLADNREAAARQRVVDAAGERALADDGELRRCRQRTPDQRAERKDERRLGCQRVHAGRAFVQEQAGAKATAAKELPQQLLRQRHTLGVATRRIDTQVAAVVAEWHQCSLPSRVGGEDQEAVVVAERGQGVRHELIAVQIGDKRRVQPIGLDYFGQRRKADRQRAQQLSQRVGLYFELRKAGTLARNAEKFNMHGVCRKRPLRSRLANGGTRTRAKSTSGFLKMIA
jgi:hypothetical protein